MVVEIFQERSLTSIIKNIRFLGDQYSEAQDKLTIAKSLADKWGGAIIEMLNLVWERQKEAIQQVMKGGKATLCYYKMNCRDRAQCFSAHSDNELIPLVRDRLKQMGEIKNRGKARKNFFSVIWAKTCLKALELQDLT